MKLMLEGVYSEGENMYKGKLIMPEILYNLSRGNERIKKSVQCAGKESVYKEY